MISVIMLMASLIMGLFVAAVPHVLWLICFLAGKIFNFPLHYAPFGWTALGLVLFLWAILAWGFFVGRFRLEVKNVDYTNERIPAEFDGYKAVQISDLHLSTFDDRHRALQRFVDTINAQNPDLICFTGDLVTMGREEAEPYTEILKQLHARDGVVSVMGNHDFLIYSRNFPSDAEREAAVEKLAAYERDTLGWRLLRNQSFEICRAASAGAATSDDARTIDGAATSDDAGTIDGAAKITIVGVDNRNCSGQGFATIDRGDLGKAMEGVDTTGFQILLSHDPSHWEAEVLSTSIPLTLSGHTHASQMRFFGWNPAALMFRESDGRYDIGTQTLYVNPGLGCTLPVRLGCPAQVTVFTLHR